MNQNDAELTVPAAGGNRMHTIFLSIICVVALLGVADASYLTVTHLVGEDSVCGAGGGCATVLSSRYASVGRMPTAAFGMLAYFSVFSLAVFAAFGHHRLRFLLSLVVAMMFLATLGFLYLQAFVLHAFCPFCLASAALTFCLAGLVLITPGAD